MAGQDFHGLVSERCGVKLNIAINGACGRMGRTIGRLLFQSKDLALAAALERRGHSDEGKDYGVLLGMESCGVAVHDHMHGRANALIDFSAPESTMLRLKECLETRTPMVIGTTGLGPKHIAALRKASKKIPCVISTNMSVGVNVLFQIAPEIVKALGPEYDIEIVETHHNQKKDSPSGTARTLAEKCAEARGWKTDRALTHGRKGLQPRKQNEIGMHAVRAGGVVGEHRLILASSGDVFEITHRAQTRDIFAAGALRAARFAAHARPGLYSMADVLRHGS